MRHGYLCMGCVPNMILVGYFIDICQIVLFRLFMDT